MSLSVLTVARSAASADVVMRRLESLAPLGGEAQNLVRSLDNRQQHPSGAELGGERAGPPRARFLLSGWAARVRWLADGRRQILGFFLPGDAIGLRHPRPPRPAAITAVTPLQTVDAAPVLGALAQPRPPAGLAEALMSAADMEEALLYDQVVRLGRQTAYERICHLLLELHDRLADVGLCRNNGFALPLTQEVLADATGLSIVHVNRILQQLRRDQLIDLRSGRATLLDIDQLKGLADYHRPAAPGAGV